MLFSPIMTERRGVTRPVFDHTLPKRNRVITEYSLRDHVIVCGTCIICLMRQSLVMMGCQFCGFGDETPGSQQMRPISFLFLILFTYAHSAFTDTSPFPSCFSTCCCGSDIQFKQSAYKKNAYTTLYICKTEICLPNTCG